jgi:hypothetical protein
MGRGLQCKRPGVDRSTLQSAGGPKLKPKVANSRLGYEFTLPLSDHSTRDEVIPDAASLGHFA